MYISLHTIKFIEQEFEKLLFRYNIKTYLINEFEKVLVIEDSLILYIKISISEMPICLNAKEIYKNKENKYFEIPQANHDYYRLDIEELTYNAIDFKFSTSNFISKIKETIGIDFVFFNYSKYVGFIRQIWDCKKGCYTEKKTNIVRINALLPHLNLLERCDVWTGFHYYIIVIEIEAYDKNMGVGVFYTNKKPYQYITEKCNGWIKYGFEHGNMNMIYDINSTFPREVILSKYPYHLESALDTFNKKGLKRQYILENYLKYYYFEKKLKNKDDIEVEAHELFKHICLNNFDNIEKYTYTKPTNKWITEELVCQLCKKLFKGKNKVIYQHRPFFLKGKTGGQMSYDIFITELNIAIEYQGKQHFEPVEFFGGEESFKSSRERDKLKKHLSDINGVKLVYINYWEDVSIELIKKKISEVCNIST